MSVLTLALFLKCDIDKSEEAKVYLGVFFKVSAALLHQHLQRHQLVLASKYQAAVGFDENVGHRQKTILVRFIAQAFVFFFKGLGVCTLFHNLVGSLTEVVSTFVFVLI